MTVGTWSKDQTFYWPPLGTWVGRKKEKSWNGIDRPKEPKTPRPFRLLYRREVNRKGQIRWVPYRLSVFSERPRKARGDAPHPYEMYWIEHMRDQIYLPNTGGAFTFDQLVGSSGWTAKALNTPSDDYKLLSRLRDAIQGSEFNLGIMLGESKTTFQYLGDLTRSLARFGLALRKGAYLDAIDALRGPLGGPRSVLLPNRIPPRNWRAQTLSQRLLEFQYAVRPLLGDAKAAAEFLAHHLSVPLQQRYRVKVKMIDTSNSLSSFHGSQETVKTHRRSLIAFVREHPSVIQQLGLLDPEVVAWELIPFSFVADWFLPIGAWLEARAFAKKVEGSFVYSDKMQSDIIWSMDKTKGRIDWPSDSPQVWRNTWFKRTLSSYAGVPFPRVKPLAEALSVEHALNGIALLNVVFNGGSKSKPLPDYIKS